MLRTVDYILRSVGGAAVERRGPVETSRLHERSSGSATVGSFAAWLWRTGLKSYTGAGA